MGTIAGALLVGVALAPALWAAPAVGWAQEQRPVCTARRDVNAAGAKVEIEVAARRGG